MTPKIATCCHCSTRAVLSFDRARHELVCSGRGAPLREMKSLPIENRRCPRKACVKAGGPVKAAQKAE
jgi:hypothetical protein